MVLLRKILFPFAAVYGFVTQIRNFLYDRGLLRSTSFATPVIAVGNLSVGGTGKSPQIEYLIRLLSPRFKVATLSRGYKRKSSGFVLAGEDATARSIGDEPFQFHTKFPQVTVAVDADRTHGIKKLLAHGPDVILLDDAFQHRKVTAGLYILLTSYGDLYIDDFLLPTGNLREGRRGARRADVIIVTKCPPGLSLAKRNVLQSHLRLKPGQQLYFTTIAYGDAVVSGEAGIGIDEIRETPKTLIAGIARPKPFFDYLKRQGDTVLNFADHHHFSDSEIEAIRRQSAQRPIVTTEKDYVRLKDSALAPQLYYLPISSAFLDDSDTFDQTILDYVGKSTANR